MLAKEQMYNAPITYIPERIWFRMSDLDTKNISNVKLFTLKPQNYFIIFLWCDYVELHSQNNAIKYVEIFTFC